MQRTWTSAIQRLKSLWLCERQLVEILTVNVLIYTMVSLFLTHFLNV